MQNIGSLDLSHLGTFHTLRNLSFGLSVPPVENGGSIFLHFTKNGNANAFKSERQ